MFRAFLQCEGPFSDHSCLSSSVTFYEFVLVVPFFASSSAFSLPQCPSCPAIHLTCTVFVSLRVLRSIYGGFQTVGDHFIQRQFSKIHNSRCIIYSTSHVPLLKIRTGVPVGEHRTCGCRA